MVKVVLFDLGNTLIYFDASWSEALPRAMLALVDELRARGYDLERHTFAAEIYQRIQAYYQQRDDQQIEYTTEYVLNNYLVDLGFADNPAHVLQPALEAMYAVTQSHWKTEDDAHATLQQLQESGYRLGMISNAGDARDVHRLVDNAGLRPYFEQILISAEVGLRKPHPRIFEQALEFFAVSPAQAVMVGDTLEADILGANNLGMRSIWITRRVSPADNHRNSILPGATVAALGEIPPLLASW